MTSVAGEPQRISVLLRSLDGGGMQRCAITLAEAFACRGFEVDLLVSDTSGPMRDQIPASLRLVPLAASSHLVSRVWAALADIRGVPVIWPLLAGACPRMVRHLPALTRYLRETPPVALLALGTQSNLTALWAKRLSRTRTRIVISELNIMSSVARYARRRFRRIYPRIARRVFPSADGIVAVSKAVAGDLANSAALPPGRIATIHNPAVTPQMAEAARAPFSHPWFSDDSPPVVLAVGRLHWQKGFPTLLRAFARVRAARPSRLVILGEGSERESLTKLADSLGVADDVAFPGFVANPFAWMARASVFVLSSVSEGFGNVLCEAMACGCPIVSIDCPGGPREILDEGRYGQLVPAEDDRAMAQAILEVLDSPPDRERLYGRASLFTVDRAAERYLAVLMGRELPA
jgi:glycosyltransferase involved in cell wall biosynthesis